MGKGALCEGEYNHHFCTKEVRDSYVYGNGSGKKWVLEIRGMRQEKLTPGVTFRKRS